MQNQVHLNGGALTIFNADEIQIEDCQFKTNKAAIGGAIRFKGI